MKSHDLEFEKLLIAKAIGLTFHGFDLVVGALQRGQVKLTNQY